jgi:citrate lyase beta subunit
MNETLRRSLLYVPAVDPAVLAKAPSRGADVLVVDLEDALHPDAKDEARAGLASLWPGLLAASGEREVFLRVNGADTPWHDADLAVAAALRPAAVVLPKCEDPGSVSAAHQRLGGIPLMLMVETARGVLAAAELARVDGVAGLVFGAADFRKSVRARASADELELLLARSGVVLAARAAGIEAFDTPWFDYRDPSGLKASAERARGLGFDGKTAIHPGQLAQLHQTFAPSADEVARAERVITAIEEAALRGRGVATVDGELVEALHAVEARRILARRAAALRRDPAAPRSG